jgi:hypothetical protein
VSYGQYSYYGYRSRNSATETEVSNSKISCDDAVKLVERNGRYLNASFGGYKSDAIEKIRWYEYERTLYCIVFFKSNIYKGYIYGGWEYDFDKYYKLKTEFERSESKGEFFWDYIEENKIECEKD